MRSKLKSFIGAEKLNGAIGDYIKEIDDTKIAKKRRMHDILIHIEDVFRNVERTYDDQLDHNVVQTYSKLKSR